MYRNKKVIAFDLDGTLTQHRTPLEEKNMALLKALSEKYYVMIVGAGTCQRIRKQINYLPLDIIGNYGMEYEKYDLKAGKPVSVYSETTECDEEDILKRADIVRKRFGYTEYAGDSVGFHSTGAFTLALLGTGAAIEDKLSFDCDHKKRFVMLDDVKAIFPDYNVFIGGSSSFDMVKTPYDKYYALDRFCKSEGLSHKDLVFVGDGYGIGENDESVYKSDIDFICVDDYRDCDKIVRENIEL